MKFTLPWLSPPQAAASKLTGVKNALLTGLLLLTASSTSGCLNRPVCGEEVIDGELVNTCVPQTTNVIVQKLVQQSVDKIDMLFVIDNSISMADKQLILVQALPDLVQRFVSPICIDTDGVQTAHPDSGSDACPDGSSREFSPIDDIHIGVITTSLGGYGSPLDCVFSETSPNSEQKVDLAHLLGSLPRGEAAGATEDFLKWTAGANAGDFSALFGDQVRAAGEHGCGWEASLEAWYRFLIEPYPYQQIVRVNCPFGGDTNQSCIGPTVDAATGAALVDGTILTQREEFLRPDSLVAIIMLSDENDCSFRANGQSWRLAQAFLNEFTINTAFKGTAACEADPNDVCCQSCGATPPEGCPTGTNAEGQTVGVGCEDSKRYDVPPNSADGNLDDQINLRCFQQKRRFGVDYLYPVERYSNALTLPKICPFADDLEPTSCSEDQLVDNPLYDDLTYQTRLLTDPTATRETERASSLVFLAGIVGVPWQDVAVSPNVEDELVYRVASAGATDDQKINWDWIVGAPTDGIPEPMDPLMIESVDPRSGTNPATGEALADQTGGQLANSINGHEWNIALRQDLQYACIFPTEAKDCADPADMVDTSIPQPNCDCTEFGAAPDEAAGTGYNNPLCQAGDGSYDRTQRFAKAYPSLRQLQVLRDYGNNSIVASICPKEIDDPNAADFGYRPAVGSIVARLKEQLADKCLPRELSLREDKSVECRIIEAKKLVGTLETCAELGARDEVAEEVQVEVRKSLESSGTCEGEDCKNFRMCEIKQLEPGSEGLRLCLEEENVAADGWCYIDPFNSDPDKRVGSEALVEKCQATERRKLRFVGDGTPDNGTVTFVACAGAVLDEN